MIIKINSIEDVKKHLGSINLNDYIKKKYYDEYQKIAYEQKPFIYIYSPIIITAIRTKYKNIFPSGLAGITYNLEEIYEE